ncbi:cytochrome P450 [Streptomyces justiciae]|uniref:Cytochrome P450 n=1 Tax=Streptomyces justiciae TaxID=2780140 RepID=A0ABU3LIQ0_9ACTN|nr:cytochrome P450 [Streptomyces justiciae]MDT7839102.1 cytochrome P450 [Streptomyces justiciae]
MTQSFELPVDKRRNVLDPVPELLELNARAPLFRPPGGMPHWIVTDREVVRQILADAERFSSMPPPEPDGRKPDPHPGSLLQTDGAEHSRLRRLVAPMFTVRQMKALEPMMARIVDQRLEVLERAGRPADLMRYFARPVSGLILAELIGLPRDDLSELSRLGDHRASGHSPRRHPATSEYVGHFRKLAAAQRRDPGEGLAGMLIREHGDAVSDEEVAGICESVANGSIENTAETIGLGVLALLCHPDQLTLLRERPELMDRAVEELLRYVSVVASVSPRTALVDVEIGGELIKAGEVVSCSVFAANRCPYGGDDGTADRLDVAREPGNHLALGFGVHFCLGAALARLQLRIALTGLLERFPGLRLGTGVEELRFRSLAPQFGVETLPVLW